MIDIEEIEKRWLRIGELMDATGKSIEEMLALYASDDEYPPFKCDDCPLRKKYICIPGHKTSCYDLWLYYLEGK